MCQFFTIHTRDTEENLRKIGHIITTPYVCSIPREMFSAAEDFMIPVGDIISTVRCSVLWGEFWEFFPGVGYLMLNVRIQTSTKSIFWAKMIGNYNIFGTY